MNSQSSSVISSKSNIREEGAIEIQQVDFIRYLENLNEDIGLLKMDIEGAEVDLLEALFDRPDILNRIDHIFAETHETRIPGQRAARERTPRKGQADKAAAHQSLLALSGPLTRTDSFNQAANEAQIIGVLRETEAGVKKQNHCRALLISQHRVRPFAAGLSTHSVYEIVSSQSSAQFRPLCRTAYTPWR